MSDDLLHRWPEAERILDDVIDLPVDERRARALDACGADAGLRHLVAQLLAEDSDDAALRPALDVVISAANDIEPDDGPLPVRVGSFRVVGELGRGGMGRVVLAEREDSPYAQRIALKLLESARHSPDALQRFDRERATLARLHHPHIARLHDGGVTPEGVPYLVMELVDGLPIDDHCDRHALDIDARLRLFLQVCSAVEYAHSRLVVHRDLKSANVLVDAHGQVKLLDFGIAKWLEELEGNPVLTQTSHRVLTPSHAAPEQFLGEPVTAATDVYQLGLLLYELLTGVRAQGSRSSTPEAIRQAVLQTEAERASRAVTRADDAPAIGKAAAMLPDDRARRRSTTVEGLSRRLSGDIDAILMKALRKEPTARYPTVEALRRDITDYLEHRPVSARRGSTIYTLRKYARRHRAALAATAGILISAVAGIAGIALQSRVTALERDRAQAAEAKASAINTFLVHELLTAATPERAGGQTLTVAEVLGNASRSVAHAFPGESDTEADIRQTLARSYAAIGQLEAARAHASEARAILTRTHQPDDAVTLRARTLLAKLTIDEGRFADARGDLEQIVSAQATRLGATHADTLRTRALLGRTLRELGEAAASEAMLRESVAVAAANRGNDWRDWRLDVELRTELAETLLVLTKGVEAEALGRQLIDTQRTHLGPAHPEVLRSLQLRATALTVMLRYKDAVDAHREAVALHDQIYGPDHRLTARAVLRLGVAHGHFNANADAGAAFERAHRIYERTLGPEHPETLRALRNVAIAHRRKRDFVRAEPLYRRILEIRRRTLGERHPAVIESLVGLNEMLADAGRTEEARRAGREVITASEALAAAADADPLVLDDFAIFLLDVKPADLRDPSRALALAERAVAATSRRHYLRLRTLGRAQVAVARPDLALATVREALALPASIQSWTLEQMMVDLLRERGTTQELEAWLRARYEQFERLGRPDDYLAGKTLRHLAQLYLREGRLEEAEQRFAQALAQYRKTAPDSNWEVGRAKSELGERLAARRAFAEAEPLLLQGFDALTGDPQTRPEYIAAARTRIVALYEAWPRVDEAQRWRARAGR
jgi:serine/threonine protein kinase/tetratricopeptide (TPR) repeat protein